MRLKECYLLRWSEVDWGTARITKQGKGGKLVTLPITSTIREIIWPLRGHDPEFVFTYEAQTTRDGRVKGNRYPLTREGIKTAWRRLRESADVQDFGSMTSATTSEPSCYARLATLSLCSAL